MAKELTPIEAFLAPLARLARKHRDIEGLVFWGGEEGWGASPSEALEAEEIAFYAEGLLIDGFHMDWALVGEGEAIHIPLGQPHRLENPGRLPVRLIAVETGCYLGEDDLIRHEMP